jgi:hypothetical protein
MASSYIFFTDISVYAGTSRWMTSWDLRWSLESLRISLRKSNEVPLIEGRNTPTRWPSEWTEKFTLLRKIPIEILLWSESSWKLLCEYVLYRCCPLHSSRLCESPQSRNCSVFNRNLRLNYPFCVNSNLMLIYYKKLTPYIFEGHNSNFNSICLNPKGIQFLSKPISS